ncbi:GNAT family N-acetyltransferase [Serratia entomophila]|uniref:GNAT family N-acetyltransferase n=1 Tax=Serratia entomophila TaxID=42906 RepID=UPI002177D058|nr:GNAT family N-acetyltransferase [Serratia entomophila]CAI0892922.1 Predicted acetyltransferase [Serratia entomophila]CAI0895942.1 Predicted acetyltransferase [Serratia entomophila]CAI0900756.1 Predicted acetyltransferase [Serratia entomophila]CAI0996638.1 Predicted acetyltransferase [Serratia entomophila]CAI1582835.1 Predicted acetyltransferase [Serratia entomophila]
MLDVEPYRESCRLQTAALIYSAFSDKFRRPSGLSARQQWRLFYRLWNWKQSDSQEHNFVVRQAGKVVAAFGLTFADSLGNAALRGRPLPIMRLCRCYGMWNFWRMYLQIAVLQHIPAADEVYLSYLAVDETQRGKGVGKMLLQWIAEYAVAQRPNLRLRLHVSQQNVGAQHLYRQCGFRSGRPKKYISLWLLFSQPSWLVMEKSIGVGR